MTTDLETNLQIIEEFTQRLQVAVIGAEETTDKHVEWVEGPVDATIDTANGPLKTLRGQIAEWRLTADQDVASAINGYDSQFSTALAQFNSEFEAYLITIGFEPAIEYTAGIIISRRSQTVIYNGVTYYWTADLPHTTNGDFGTEVSWQIAPIVGGIETPSFNFASGGKLLRKTQSVLGLDGEWYYWTGVFPKVIPPASTLESAGGVGQNLFKIASGYPPLRSTLKLIVTSIGMTLNSGSFEAGATIIESRDLLVQFLTGKVYKWNGALPKVVDLFSTPSSSGGVGPGVWEEVATSYNKTMIIEALRRSYAEAGYTLVIGSFESGGVINTVTDVLLYETDGLAYKWGGVIPVGGKIVPPGSTPTPLGLDGWINVGGAFLRSKLLSAAGASIVTTSRGASVEQELTDLVTFKATGADVPYSPQDRARVRLSAVDFIPQATDLGAAINAVRTSLETEYGPSASIGVRGGDCFLPRGTRASLTPINLERHASGVTSFNIRGQGQMTTQLDMTGAPAFTDGITGGTGGPAFCDLADFNIKKAPRSGTRLEKYSRMTFRNLEMRENGADGYYFGIGFVIAMEKLLSTANAANGFNFDVTLQHTSHAINSGYAYQNAGIGWVFGFMTYCAANALASDNNALYGYSISRSDGFVLNGCGAESNGRSAFAVLSSTAIGATKNTTINNAFAYHNNLSAAGYPNLLYALAADGQAAHVRISKSKSIPSVGDTTKDIIADGVGAEIEIDDCELVNGWESRNGGYIHWKPKTLLVRGLTIPVAPAATPVCKLQSTQGHKVRYAGEITVLASNMAPSTGERNITIYKLLVCKSIAGGAQVTEIAKLGHTTGGGTSSPAFSWTMSGDQLVATPLGSAGGTQFWFEIDTSSQIVASL